MENSVNCFVCAEDAIYEETSKFYSHWNASACKFYDCLNELIRFGLILHCNHSVIFLMAKYEH